MGRKGADSLLAPPPPPGRWKRAAGRGWGRPDRPPHRRTGEQNEAGSQGVGLGVWGWGSERWTRVGC